MQEFFVANYKVDILRNQIVREGQVIALEPKVLEVLKVLAEHSGEVVSHQILLDTVWPDIVVAPNALQRCIGQLRKALNDDGKAQKVIVTHPKKGYSLVAPVSIRTEKNQKSPVRINENVTNEIVTVKDDTVKNNTSDKEYSPKRRFKRNIWVLIISLIVFYSSLSFYDHMLSPQQHDKEQSDLLLTNLQTFTQLKPLTATDESEFYSTFSPDGRYVAFSRNVPFSVNTTSSGGHMWLIDRDTGQETQLTQYSGRYGQPNWSSDGKQLAFLQLDSRDEPKSGRCVDINLLYVPLALKDPQPTKTLVSCKNIPLQGLQWIDNENLIAIVSNYSKVNKNNNIESSRLVQISSHTGDVKSLYQSSDAQMYALSWSEIRKQLAVMQAQPQHPPSVLLFSPETQKEKVLIFTAPKRYRTDTRWYPIWHPSGDYLLFSAASRLYLMDLDGNLESQVIPTFQDISRPMFHPDGSSIAMTLGKVDRDIAQLQLIEEQDSSYQRDSTHEKALYIETPIARSILRENDAQYQPNGNKIAFFSQRSGTRQLWLAEESNAKKSVRQLFQLDDVYPEYFVWSPNGEQLAISTQRLLFLVDLQGNTNTIELTFDAIRLYQWTPDNQLLMQIADNDLQERTKLVRYDMSQNSYHTEYAGQIIWAQVHWPDNQLEQQKNSEIWFLDGEHRLKRIEQNQPKIFDTTAHIKTRSRFFIKDQQLFLFSEDKYFWKLPISANQTNTEQLSTESLQRFYHYPGGNIRFTDVSESGAKLLVSKQMSSKKEIVLLTP